jgi:LmbE family N-acetylglucosaminyl deacetylase
MFHDKNILVIAPHPDDEVLGCGGIINKLSYGGNNVYVLIATRGVAKLYSDSRIENGRLEARTAHSMLGVLETLFLDFPAPELDTVPLADISSEFAKIIQKHQIEILFLPHRGDIHHDHKIIFNAGIVAARPVGNYTVKEIYCYETLSETEWAAPFGDDAFVPTYFVNIENSIEAKKEAMKCYKSQLREFPGSRSLEAIEALAKFRGATVGFRYAEAFMVIRQIKD